MCFFYSINKSAKALEERFVAEVVNKQQNMFFDSPKDVYNGFAHPAMPLITNSEPAKIQFFEWGLLPAWAKDKKFQDNTLNARLETLHEKPSFKNMLGNRCLIPADGFLEWQWQDPKGKQKIKYLLEISESPIFAFAGLWSQWVEPSSGNVIPTFTIITTEANPLMAEIHNTKKRMPVILTPESEKLWLEKGEISMWNDKLSAVAV